MLHRRLFPKDYLEDLIDELADIYPKCFFTDPRDKRPLKKGITEDLANDHFKDRDERNAVINFYTRDWNYEWCLQAGTRRVDLEGREAGTVTEQEEREARERVRSQQQKIKADRERTAPAPAPVVEVKPVRILEAQVPPAAPVVNPTEPHKRGRKVGYKNKEKTGLEKLIRDFAKILTNIEPALYSRIAIAILEDIVTTALAQIE
jgi:sRNA-binding protein